MTYQYYTVEDLKARPELIKNHPLNARFGLSSLFERTCRRINDTTAEPSIKLLAKNHEHVTEVILCESYFQDVTQVNKAGIVLDTNQLKYLREHRKWDEVTYVYYYLNQGVIDFNRQLIVHFNVSLIKVRQRVASYEYEANFSLANANACRLTLIGRYDFDGQIDYTIPREYYYPALSSNEQESISPEFSASVMHMLEDIKNVVKQRHENEYFKMWKHSSISLNLNLETFTTKPAQNIYEPCSNKIEDYFQIEAYSAELGFPIIDSLKPTYFKSYYDFGPSKDCAAGVFHSASKGITFILYSLSRGLYKSSTPMSYTAFAIIKQKWLVKLSLTGCFYLKNFFNVCLKEVQGKKVACIRINVNLTRISLLADMAYLHRSLHEYLHLSTKPVNLSRKSVDHYKPLEDYFAPSEHSLSNKSLTILKPYLKDIMQDVKMLMQKNVHNLVIKDLILNGLNKNKNENKLTIEALNYDSVEIEFENFEYYEPN